MIDHRKFSSGHNNQRDMRYIIIDKRDDILKCKILYIGNESRDIRVDIDTRNYLRYEI